MCLQAMERFEDLGDVRGRDARPVVGHVEDRVAICRTRDDGDMHAWSAMTHRVLDEIPDDPADVPGICRDGQIGRERRAHGGTAGLARQVRLDGLRHDDREVAAIALVAEDARRTSQCEQVVRQAGQAIG